MRSNALSTVAQIIMGQSPPSSSYNLRGQGLPFFQGKADFGDMYPKVRVFCTEPLKVAEAGDILISVRAPVGPTNINLGKSCIGRGLAALRCLEGFDTNYLLYFLRFYEPRLAQISTGSTFEAISRDDLENICVPIIPLSEQKRITTILEKADRLRRQRHYALELSSTYLQSVFLEMFGDPATNPKGWRVDQLFQLCDKIVDCPHATPIYASNQTAYACIRSSDIQNGFLDWSTTKYVDLGEYEKRIKTTIPMPRDVVYCREGARFGNAAMIPTDKQVCLGQRMMLFRAAVNVATPELLWAFLESESTYRQAIRLAGGSASPHLNVGDIKEFVTVIPPLSLQHKFAQIVQKFERFRAQQLEALRQAEHLFQTLLHQAFQGEFELRSVAVDMPPMAVDVDDASAGVCVSDEGEAAVYQLSLLVD